MPNEKIIHINGETIDPEEKHFSTTQEDIDKIKKEAKTKGLTGYETRGEVVKHDEKMYQATDNLQQSEAEKNEAEAAQVEVDKQARENFIKEYELQSFIDGFNNRMGGRNQDAIDNVISELMDFASKRTGLEEEHEKDLLKQEVIAKARKKLLFDKI